MTTTDRHRHAPNLTCPWSVIGALIAFVIVLAVFAQGSGTLLIDARATALTQALDGSVFSVIADVGNLLGESRYAVTLVVTLVALTAITRSWREMAFLVFVLAFRGTGTVLKGVIDSPRPTSDVAEVVRAFDGLGFPSGHSMTSSAAAGGIVFLTLRQRDSRKVRLVLACVWILCVSLTAFARIWGGAHWLTDTIGGTTIGAVIVLLSANLSSLVATRRAQPHESTV
jgi:undecaprenyl-diphosphatase